MPVPDFQSFMLPLMRMAGDELEHSLPEVVERLADEFHLSADERAQVLQSGQTRVYNRVGWATTYLKKAGLLRAVGRGRFQITEHGSKVLASNPDAIDVAFLEEQFPEIRVFRNSSSAGAEGEPPAAFDVVERTWALRPGVEAKVRAKLEQALLNEETRRSALALLAFAIESADEERPEAWYVREMPHGFALMAGRLLTCEVKRSRVRLSVMGPIRGRHPHRHRSGIRRRR